MITFTTCWKRCVAAIVALFAGAFASAQDEPPTHTAPTDAPAFASPLTLEAALDLAVSNNPRLEAKRLELGIAEGELRQASIYFQNNPEVSAWVARRHEPGENNFGRALSASLSPFAAPSVSISADGSLSREDSESYTDFNLEVAQEFEVFGQPRVRRAAAEAQLQTTLADIAGVAWDVMQETRAAYYRVQTGLRRAELLAAQREAVEAMRDLAQRRFEAGDIARTEYRQLEIQAAQIANELLLAQSDIDAAKAELAAVLGLESLSEIEVVDMLPPPVPPPPLLLESLQDHPRLQYARLLAEQRHNEAEFVRRDARPNVTGSLFWTREEGDMDIVGVGVSVPVPVFNRGQGNIAAARARTDVAEARVVAERRRLRAAASSALQQYVNSMEAAVRYSEQVLPMIAQNLEVIENAYRVGDISMVDLRLSQRELLETQRTALDVLEEHYRWRAELEGLLGRSLDTGPIEEEEIEP